jgi:hypothetical protein
LKCTQTKTERHLTMIAPQRPGLPAGHLMASATLFLAGPAHLTALSRPYRGYKPEINTNSYNDRSQFGRRSDSVFLLAIQCRHHPSSAVPPT